MDHLKTDHERKARWYATRTRPRYVRVVNVTPHDNKNDDDFVVPSVTADGVSEVHGIPAELFGGTKTTSSPSFASRATKLLHEHLQTHGFAIVTGALTQVECEEALNFAWDYVELASCAERWIQQQQQRREKQEEQKEPQQWVSSLEASPPVRRNDPSTLSSPYFPKSVEGGIFPYYGSGHSTFGWYVRSHPAVQSIFAALYGVEKQQLISSLDGMVLWRAGREYRTDAGWFHIDQNPRYKPKFECAQGIVNLLPVTTQTGGNVLVMKSHLLFPHHYYHHVTSLSVSFFDDGSRRNNNNAQQTTSKERTELQHHGNDSCDGECNGDDIDYSSPVNSAAIPSLSHDHPAPLSASTQSSLAVSSSSCTEFYHARLNEIGNDDWLEIDPNDDIMLGNASENIICCLLKPGDVLLWDSRVVHCSFPGELENDEKDDDDDDDDDYDNEKRDGNATMMQSTDSNCGHDDLLVQDTVQRHNATLHGGLIRVASIVSMMPQSRVSESVLRRRKQAVDDARTLTHWVNKVAPLGEEREDEAAKEKALVSFMKRYQESYAGRRRRWKKVLLEFDDLNNDQKLLVCGNISF